MQVGEIWIHDRYYFDHGQVKPKWVLVLGVSSGDIIVRTLTSREHLRSADTCSHDPIKPHYALGVLNQKEGLGKFSWLDLLGHDDIDPVAWKSLANDKTLRFVMCLRPDVICPLLLCAANAPGTTKNQAKAMFDSRTFLKC